MSKRYQVEIEIGGKKRVFKFWMLALKNIEKDYKLQDIDDYPYSFLVDFAYTGFMIKSKENELPKGFDKNMFEEWFDDIEMKDLEILTTAIRESMTDLGKMMLGQQAMQTEPQQNGQTKVQVSKTD